jgi:hypothetical protein
VVLGQPALNPNSPDATVESAAPGASTINLDAKGNYQVVASKQGGCYAFDNKTTKFTFLSGPLKDWPASYQITRESKILWLSRFPKETPPDQDWKDLGGIKCRFVEDEKADESSTEPKAPPQEPKKVLRSRSRRVE